jgi:hypothetical protein
MTRFGWCQFAPGARPDQHHDLCPGRYVTPMGVERVCDCPGHEHEEEEA